jgi:hypothetical protein
MAIVHGWYRIAASCCGLMPGSLSPVTVVGDGDGDGGGGACVDRSSAEATEIVAAATNAAKIIERMAFPS